MVTERGFNPGRDNHDDLEPDERAIIQRWSGLLVGGAIWAFGIGIVLGLLWEFDQVAWPIIRHALVVLAVAVATTAAYILLMIALLVLWAVVHVIRKRQLVRARPDE